MMPDRDAARAGSSDAGGRDGVGRAWRAVLALLVVALALLAPGTAAAQPATASPARAASSDPAGIALRTGDVRAVVTAALRQLNRSAVALVAGSTADPGPLTAVTTDARHRDVSLWIVSVGPDQPLSQDQTNSVGDQVLGAKGGTVIVLSADWITIRSDSYSSDARQAASDAAAGAGSSDAAAARAALDSLTAKAFPWGWVILAVVIAVVVVALAGAWWERRRRRRADADELARLTSALADRVGALAPTIVTLSDQVPLSGRSDLVDRFNQASADYNTLRDRLAKPLASRRAVRTMDGKVGALESTIADLSTAVGAVTP
jgi:hypothetical protein